MNERDRAAGYAVMKAYQQGRDDQKKAQNRRETWITWIGAGVIVLLYHVFFSGWGC